MSLPLPVLDRIEIASPCTASWDEMTGTDRVRFCGQCQLQVYNLSAMSRDEAQRLLGETPERLCVRLYRRTDGTMLTQDCPRGLEAVRRAACKALVATTAKVAAVLALFLGPLCLLWGDRIRDTARSRLGNREPFQTILSWFDPPAPQVFMGAPVPTVLPPGGAVMGEVCPPGKPAPAEVLQPK
jgi:hypothetical protein